MCGIAGFIDRSIDVSAEAVLRRMSDSLSHRGPDGSGYWCDREAGVALGHRRLAVVDVSSAGQQPMHSRVGRYVIVFNGEIYNFLDIGKELVARGHNFIGHSDTEVLLAAIEEWGIDATLNRTVGMFAFAVFDRQERCLTLARDRMGKKPLYYGFREGRLFFGSELHALRQFPNWRPRVDRQALTLFMRHSYVPAR